MAQPRREVALGGGLQRGTQRPWGRWGQGWGHHTQQGGARRKLRASRVLRSSCRQPGAASAWPHIDEEHVVAARVCGRALHHHIVKLVAGAQAQQLAAVPARHPAHACVMWVGGAGRVGRAEHGTQRGWRSLEHSKRLSSLPSQTLYNSSGLTRARVALQPAPGRVQFTEVFRHKGAAWQAAVAQQHHALALRGVGGSGATGALGGLECAVLQEWGDGSSMATSCTPARSHHTRTLG